MKVTVVSIMYNTFPEIIGSMMNQTHQDWELFIIHDGPSKLDVPKIIEGIGDPRIKYIETQERSGNWGYVHRAWALMELKEERLSDGEFVLITNADNHHVPIYLETLLEPFKNNPNIVGTYCSHMIHTWPDNPSTVMECWLEEGRIDCAGAIVRKEAAVNLGWRNLESPVADWLYYNDIISIYGKDKFAKVKGCLLIHN